MAKQSVNQTAPAAHSSSARRPSAPGKPPLRRRKPEPAPESKGPPARAPHVVILVENMTVPPDRRVWQQALALKDDGWRVTVVTPHFGDKRPKRETLEGVNIIRHPMPLEARGLLAYAVEYTSALFYEAASLFDIGLNDIDVVQICNPPDFLFAPALLAKVFGGAKIVFDHHDLTPELLADKIGDNKLAQSIMMPIANWAQRTTFDVADQVISTNGAFHDIAIVNGGKDPEDVCVVYSGPDLDRMLEVPPDPSLKKGASTLLFWVGIMGSQDGLDLLLEALVALRDMPGGDDFHLLLAGDGPEREEMERQAKLLGLAPFVTFAGFLSGVQLAQAFVTADIGVGSDPKNPFNDRLAMNKVMEYMARRLPIAMFDLQECRLIAEGAALYASDNDPRALAAALSNLITSPATRQTKGALGRERLEERFAWRKQKETYLKVYRRLRAEMPEVSQTAVQAG